jgi:FixJ family two-component response regulator
MHRLEGHEMLSTPTDRRSQRYGFASVDSMTDFFSKWIPEAEIQDLVQHADTHFRPRAEASEAETELQKIQKAEFAIVRRLVRRNPTIP